MGLTIDLFDKYDIKKLFDEYYIWFQKKFGQNFLLNRAVVDEIVESLGLTADDLVLEIGAGIGTFTHRLLATGASVQCYEIDYKFVDILNRFFGDNEKFSVVVGDVLKTFTRSLQNLETYKRVVVFGSLPYYIATPILEKVIACGIDFDSINVILQSEMQQRILAKPTDDKYCRLSLLVNTFYTPNVVRSIASDNFIPEPNVDSVFIRMLHRQTNIENRTIYFNMCREIFLHRRKKFINNLLGNIIIQNVGKENLCEIFKSMQLDENIRGDGLQISQIAELSNKINETLNNTKD